MYKDRDRLRVELAQVRVSNEVFESSMQEAQKSARQAEAAVLSLPFFFFLKCMNQ